MSSTSKPTLSSISPFFIVGHLDRSVAFYRDRLGFDVTLTAPDSDPFFAIVRRDGVQIMLKRIADDCAPTPNHTRHAFARWDAFVYAPDPDALAAEFASRGVAFHVALADTNDGLRGFEICDADGYVLFFGHPRP